jgi:hypothetical protein
MCYSCRRKRESLSIYVPIRSPAGRVVNIYSVRNIRHSDGVNLSYKSTTQSVTSAELDLRLLRSSTPWYRCGSQDRAISFTCSCARYVRFFLIHPLTQRNEIDPARSQLAFARSPVPNDLRSEAH